MEQVLGLLRQWSAGGPCRQPWALLAAISAPVRDQAYMKFARGQILRTSATAMRRYEIRYSDWPYRLFGLIATTTTAADKAEIVRSLLGAPARELDTYSLGLRRMFGSAALLSSDRCREVLLHDFRCHPYAIDQAERLNSEVSRMHAPRAPGKQFLTSARESLLRQATALHMTNHGAHPLRPERVSRSTDVIEQNPLLPLPHGVVKQDRLADHGGPLALRPIAAGDAGVLDDGVAAAMPGVLHGASVPHEQRPGFARVARYEKAVLSYKPSAAQPPADDEPKVGLSRYMLQFNREVQAMKASLGRRLTLTEYSAFRADFKQRWANQGDNPVFKDAYDEWRHSGREAPELRDMVPYKAAWGCGCVSTPICPAEFHRYVVENGWPTDSEVFGGTVSERPAAPSDAMECDDEVSPWGWGRQPRNIDPESIADMARYSLIESGLNVYLEYIGKGAAEAAEEILMIHGTPTTDGGPKRLLFIVSGVCWNPKALVEWKRLKCRTAVHSWTVHNVNICVV